MVGDKNADTVYVCEAAIDAISLMILQQKYNPKIKACYASIGGVKDKAIDKLKSMFKKVIIAVDNDDKAYEFRDKHTDLFNIVPPAKLGNNGQLIKDWNDVLCFCDNADVIKKSLTDGFYDRNLPF